MNAWTNAIRERIAGLQVPPDRKAELTLLAMIADSLYDIKRALMKDSSLDLESQDKHGW